MAKISCASLVTLLPQRALMACLLSLRVSLSDRYPLHLTVWQQDEHIHPMFLRGRDGKRQQRCPKSRPSDGIDGGKGGKEEGAHPVGLMWQEVGPTPMPPASPTVSGEPHDNFPKPFLSALVRGRTQTRGGEGDVWVPHPKDFGAAIPIQVCDQFGCPVYFCEVLPYLRVAHFPFRDVPNNPSRNKPLLPQLDLQGVEG